MMTIKVSGAKEGALAFQRAAPAVHTEVVQTVQRETLELQRVVVEEKLSGQVLHVRTGTLRRSITSNVEDTGSSVRGTVGTNVEYAHIHEYGGTLHIPEIRPVTAKALHWMSGGGDVFAMHTREHDVTIPERSFLRSALRERREGIVTAIRGAIMTGLRRALGK